MKFLDKVNSPEDIKDFKIEELEELCSEVRNYMLECCSINPGHLGSSLGAIELIVGLHYIYNTPLDKVVYDVGHQAYAHKILTGRKEDFKSNRMKGGISGFPKMSESKYDAFGVGHASTSISAALGYAEAAKLRNIDSKTVALIGDGSMSGGLAFEGMNNIGQLGSDVLIIINDNNQAIDDNIGALHKYLLRITTDPTYNKLKNRIWHRVGEGRFRNFVQWFVTHTKSSFVSKSGGDFFESLGFRYFGPIDGNDINQVTDTLSRLKDLKGPRILHAITKKGKGYKPAENSPTIWHAPGIFNLETGKRPKNHTSIDKYQDVFGHVLKDLAAKDETIVGITPAMATGCGMTYFAEAYPERFYDVGIEEEHAVTFSAGLAAGGMKPFCNIYSTFSQRAYDQIIHDVALQKLPVIMCFDRGGLVGEDGATHNGCYDMAAYRSIPNAIIASPKDEIELKNLMYEGTFTKTGPFIIRYPRGRGEGVDWRDSEYSRVEIGKGELISEGEDIAILAIGPTVGEAMRAVSGEKFETRKKPAIYNMRFVKPLDTELIDEISKKFSKIITIEDGSLKGGLYGAVTEYVMSRDYSVKVNGLGIPDVFIESDTQAGQRAFCGINEEGILKKIEEIS